MKNKLWFILLVICLGVYTRCAPAVEPTLPPPTSLSTKTPDIIPSTPAPAERVRIVWFVGLGVGTDVEAIKAQKAIVDEFNASQDRINLVLEVINSSVAYDVLEKRLNNHTAPDLAGPMGIRARDTFTEQWLDLRPLIETYHYDLTDFGPALLNLYDVPGQGQIGLPFAVFPSFIMVNSDLFKSAGIPTPPQEYGKPYIDENGVAHEWNMETFQQVAMKLTIDKNGHNALHPEFDPQQIKQFGFNNEWTDLRGRLTFFGAGNLVDDKGQAYMPPHWREAVQWYYDGMWHNYFYPSLKTAGSNLRGQFDSNKVAMMSNHLWYLACCQTVFNGQWNTAVNPTYQGQITAKIHADSFGIFKDTAHPEEAFEVLTYLLGEKAAVLADIYGGMPARISLQPDYFDQMVNEYKDQDINWEVLITNMHYPDIPHHETGLPHATLAGERYEKFWKLLSTKPDLDIPAEIDLLLQDLQKIYNEEP